MPVSLNPHITFKSENIQDNVKQTPNEQATKTETPQAIQEQNNQDKFLNSQDKKEPETKKTLKQRLASILKFFIATEEITKGTAKGAIYGTLTGGLIMGAGWFFGALPKGMKNVNSLVEVFKHPFRSISSKTKITAGITAVGIAAYHIVKGNLQANLQKTFIDQKLKNKNN